MSGHKQLLLAVVALFAIVAQADQCTLTTGKRGANDPYWLGHPSLQHGYSPYLNQGNYPVYRNVKDFGARGDGVTDDTAAINAAITAPGGRCGLGCDSTTIKPALVFFPSGTYLISAPLIQYYLTQFVGDANNLPTLLAAANFQGAFMIQSDPYGPNGFNWFTNQNNFYRQVRNFIIDTRRVPVNGEIVGVHWQVAQATSLTNIVFRMNEESNSNHQGIWMENGSGGFMSDLIFHGGKFGMWVGCQQFTSRNLTFYNSKTAIFMNWNWGWAFKGISINHCEVGIDLSTNQVNQTVGSLLLLDAVFTDTPVAVKTSMTANTYPPSSGTLTLDNVKVQNVQKTVSDHLGNTLLEGGSRTIVSWGQGHVYSSNSTGGFYRGNLPAPAKNAIMLDSHGNFLERTRPQYEEYSIDDIINVKNEGARGDGVTDDTAALTATLKKWAGCKIIFFPFGSYVITSTLYVPPGSRLVGEVWSQIKASGSFFANQRAPKAAVQVGLPGQSGVVEIADLLFTTGGNTAGAIVVEWNLRDAPGSPASSGMWDAHIRIGGAAGTNMQRGNCPSLKMPTDECMGAYMLLHLTATSSAYLENNWIWTADHDLDGDGQTSIFAGRGVLIESREGPIWMYGTASEHNVLYQYSLVNTKNVFATMIQTETPYYQGTPLAPAPFNTDSQYSDPSFADCSGDTCGYAWGLMIIDSSAVYFYGAGLYNFFNNYNQKCLDTYCQDSMTLIKQKQTDGPGLYLYNLATKAADTMVVSNTRPRISYKGHYAGFCSSIINLNHAGNGNSEPIPTDFPKPDPRPDPTRNPDPRPDPTRNPDPRPDPTRNPDPRPDPTRNGQPKQCEGNPCGGADKCCPDAAHGQQCYNPITYTCGVDSFNGKTYLCWGTGLACNGQCYDTVNYKCIDGQLRHN